MKSFLSYLYGFLWVLATVLVCCPLWAAGMALRGAGSVLLVAGNGVQTLINAGAIRIWGQPEPPSL